MSKDEINIIDQYDNEGYSSLKINIKESVVNILIEIEIPGIPKNNITLEIEPTSIEVRAATAKEKDTYQGHELRIVRKERTSGKFKRIIELPSRININESHASYHEGVLYLDLKKPVEDISTGKRLLTVF